jgi:hypothetical protein
VGQSLRKRHPTGSSGTKGKPDQDGRESRICHVVPAVKAEDERALDSQEQLVAVFMGLPNELAFHLQYREMKIVQLAAIFGDWCFENRLDFSTILTALMFRLQTLPVCPNGLPG